MNLHSRISNSEEKLSQDVEDVAVNKLVHNNDKLTVQIAFGSKLPVMELKRKRFYN